MKKVMRIAFWSLLVIGLVVSMSFAERQHRRMPCKKFSITIVREGENFFVSEDDIKNLLRERGDSIVGEPVSKIDIPKIEQVVATHPAVESVETFMSVSGELSIVAVQRRPIVRIINSNGESFYIDDRGKLMPWMPEWTAKVPVVTGAINDGYDKYYKTSMDAIAKDSALSAATPLEDIYHLAQYINADTFLHAQITQINLSAENGYEMIPRVGAQKIIFGDATNIDEKFSNLKIFYRDGMRATGSWNDYTEINLQYKNQVVCKRREDPNAPKPAVVTQQAAAAPLAMPGVAEQHSPNPDSPQAAHAPTHEQPAHDVVQKPAGQKPAAQKPTASNNASQKQSGSASGSGSSGGAAAKKTTSSSPKKPATSKPQQSKPQPHHGI
jgi:cell division protein FtsQ